MALFIKTTFFFKSAQGGWSESWHNLTAGSLAQAETDARAAGLLSLSIRALGVTLAGIRVSDQDANPKRSKLVDLIGNGLGHREIEADQAITGYADPVTRSTDQLQTSLLVRGLSPGGVRKHTWISGIPDSLVRVNPSGPDINANAVWVQKYTAWRAEFQSGRWGFRIRSRTQPAVQPQNIVDYQLQGGAGSRIGIIVNNGGPTYVAGDKVQIRNVQLINPAFRSPIGTWAVQSFQAGAQDNTTVYYLRGTEGIDPTNVFAPGNVRLVAYEAVPVSDLQIIRQTSHQRGRPFGLYRGRRSTPKRV
jgi:hypothetical protein